jgi:hypothetical protein
MKYITLCSLEILHDYYTDRRCIDFQIEPAPDTQKLLSNYRGILKQFPGGLRVLVAASSENTPFIALPADLIFAFRLRLRNPDFSLFTDLSEISPLAAPLYTHKPSAPNCDLMPVSREAWRTEQFIVQKPATKEAFVLSGRPLRTPQAAEAFIVERLEGKSTYKQYDEATKVITVNSSKTASGTAFTVTYPIAPRLENGVFADVEIKYCPGKANRLGNDNSFRITFQSRKARWKYYIITDKTNGKIALEDKEKAISFDIENPKDLAMDEMAIKLAKQYPHKQCLCFVSSGLIPCQQAARKNIQFHLNGDTVIHSLPNPPLQNYCSAVRNAASEYTLYQVIQYFNP